MSAPEMSVNAADPDGKWLYRVGGISAFALGIAYIIIIALYVPVGVPLSGAEARLTYLAGHTTAWWAIIGLSVLTDFLFVPVALALYVALKGINRNAMLVATAFGCRLPIHGAGNQPLRCLPRTRPLGRDSHDRACHVKGNLP